MTLNEDELKQPAKIGFAALFILFIGSIIFYKERILFSDCAYKSFNALNSNTLTVSEHRYGAYITELFPYLCMKLHMPVKAILKAYSLSFNCFYLAVSYGLYRYRQYGLSILMTLYCFLFISVSYFWASNEINQAVGWMFVFFGFVLHQYKKKINIGLFALPFTLLGFLTIYTHFLVIIPLGFLWAYFWMEKKRWPFSNAVSIIFSIILIIIFWIKYRSLTAQSYDAHILNHSDKFSLQFILNSFNTQVVQTFIQRCITNYWIAIIVLVAGLVSLYADKKQVLFCFVIVTFIVYIITIGIYYSQWNDSLGQQGFFHIEAEWGSIGVIAATAFVFSLLPKISSKAAIIFLICIFSVRLGYISGARTIFIWRTLFKKQVLAQMKKKQITKLALISEPLFRSKLLLDWALGDETMLTSAMNDDKPQYTFFLINRDDSKNMELIKNNKDIYMNSAQDIYKYSDINYKYFNFDTTHCYQVMSYDELFK